MLFLDELYRFSWEEIFANTKGEATPEQLEVFQHCQNLLGLRGRVAAILADIDRRCIEFTRTETSRRKRERRVHSYEDLLNNALSALQSKRGRRLAGLLQARYPVALVDEFQDTDPVQYEIFARIYAERGIWFMVGDPKQAILRYFLANFGLQRIKITDHGRRQMSSFQAVRRPAISRHDFVGNIQHYPQIFGPNRACAQKNNWIFKI